MLCLTGRRKRIRLVINFVPENFTKANNWNTFLSLVPLDQFFLLLKKHHLRMFWRLTIERFCTRVYFNYANDFWRINNNSEKSTPILHVSYLILIVTELVRIWSAVRFEPLSSGEPIPNIWDINDKLAF